MPINDKNVGFPEKPFFFCGRTFVGSVGNLLKVTTGGKDDRIHGNHLEDFVFFSELYL